MPSAWKAPTFAQSSSVLSMSHWHFGIQQTSISSTPANSIFWLIRFWLQVLAGTHTILWDRTFAIYISWNRPLSDHLNLNGQHACTWPHSDSNRDPNGCSVCLGGSRGQGMQHRQRHAIFRGNAAFWTAFTKFQVQDGSSQWIITIFTQFKCVLFFSKGMKIHITITFEPKTVFAVLATAYFSAPESLPPLT